jgi:mono/diheme cytochrome c family protein
MSVNRRECKRMHGWRLQQRVVHQFVLLVVCTLIVAARFGVTEAQKSGDSAAPGNAQDGKTLFTEETCAACHGPSGEGTAGAPKIGPDPIPFADFIGQLRHPRNQMPAYNVTSITDAQASDIYAFLKSPTGDTAAQPAVTGNAEKGKTIFVADGCYQCHSYLGQGGINGPRLAPHPIDIGAITKELRHPRAQMPPYTEKVVSERDIADIYAFLRSIPDAPNPDTIPLLNINK